MFIDVRLRTPNDDHGTYDVKAHRTEVADKPVLVRLYEWPNTHGTYDVFLHAASFRVVSFPTQYSGLRCYYDAAVNELCLVAEADAPTGMGGVIKVYKGGTAYVAYLVETTDGDASSVRVRTSTGTKSIRLKT